MLYMYVFSPYYEYRHAGLYMLLFSIFSKNGDSNMKYVLKEEIFEIPAFFSDNTLRAEI